LFVAFASPVGAVAAAVAAQRALAAHPWPMEGSLGVRMGPHTGEGILGGDNYLGLDVHRAARIAAAGHGGQVLVSGATRGLVANALPQGVSLRDLGRHRLRDLAVAEHLYDLVIEGLPAEFPPPRTLGTTPRNLPVQLTSFVGRDEEVAEVERLLDRARLVTLTGPGGVGKTRLALAVAERVRGRLDAGVVFVSLVGVTRPEQVLAAITRAIGADLGGTDAPLEALAEQLGDGRWLLVLDNLEQVLEVAGDLEELLARCPRLAILVTSRTVLGLGAEQEYPVPPLLLPADPAGVPLEELLASPAVALFVDRARAVRPDFALTQGNASVVVELCRRLEGLPLRATVQWSVDLLEPDEQSLLETAAVFVDGWTLQAAAEVAGVDEDRVLELTEALARHSLISLDRAGGPAPGPRLRMLETIRVFVAERLDARPDVAEVGRRHADYYRGLAEQADQPRRAVGQQLRGASQSEWVERLQVEAGNLAAAVRWYLAHDPGPLPHLFRVLWPFWSQRDHLGEARSWIDQLLPSADSLDPQARAELLWAVMVTAREVGDDAMALSARQRLAPLLAGIADPYLHAASQLAMAWTSPIVDDLGGALREASASLEEFRGQAEPLGTTSAGLTLGSVETTMGRYHDALRHLTEARDLAVRLGNAWLTATSQMLLGTLALVQGRLEDAQALLEEALDRSLAARSTQLVTLCLAGFAQLTFAEGNAEQAALLAGAAEGLRRLVGLRAWPSHRRAEAALVDQIRQALGVDRFDQAFAAGARLSQREAVAVVHDRLGGSVTAP
jgi:predicted ATPase